MSKFELDKEKLALLATLHREIVNHFEWIGLSKLASLVNQEFQQHNDSLLFSITQDEPSTLWKRWNETKMVKDEVPQNESLAKEEVARLDDIQKQLDEQAKILKSQHADADQLIKLKEEQIKLLEQQLSTQQNS